MIRACPKPPTYAFDAGFLAYLRTLPCLVCGRRCWGFDHVEAAHLESCRYGDAENAVPLCGSAHHREGKFSLHQLGRERFEKHWEVNLKVAAVQGYARYLAGRER
jgi:hypothetical protein